MLLRFKEYYQCGKPSQSKVAAYRVLGGYEPESDIHPWMVMLSNPGNCGGTLISHQHVLTAAHCEEFATRGFVLLGVHNADVLQQGKLKVTIRSRVAHPKYWRGGETSGYDYAILTLDHPVAFSKYIQPICLPKSKNENYLGKSVITMGWGLSAWEKNWTEPERGDDSVLRAIRLKVLPMSKCSEAKWFKDRQEEVSGKSKLDSSKKIEAIDSKGDLMCAGLDEDSLNWKGVNKGDSGGKYESLHINCSLSITPIYLKIFLIFVIRVTGSNNEYYFTQHPYSSSDCPHSIIKDLFRLSLLPGRINSNGKMNTVLSY